MKVVLGVLGTWVDGFAYVSFGLIWVLEMRVLLKLGFCDHTRIWCWMFALFPCFTFLLWLG